MNRNHLRKLGGNMNYLNKGMQTMIEGLLNEDMWKLLGEGLLKIILIMIISKFVIHMGKIAIENIFKVRRHSPMLRVSERREATLIKASAKCINLCYLFYCYFNDTINTYH